MFQILLSDIQVICLFEIFIPNLHSFRSGEGDVFMIILPVHLIPLPVHRVDKILPAHGLLHCFQNGESGLLYIGLHFPGLRILQETVFLFSIQKAVHGYGFQAA